MDPISLIFGTVGKVLDRVLPDRAANDAAKAQLATMQEAGELKAVADQVAVDLAEAQSKSIFVSGWRPFVGWVCGFAFLWAFVLQPFAIFVAAVLHRDLPKTLPALDLGTMMPVLLGMLGLGALRSYDKTQGTGNGH